MGKRSHRLKKQQRRLAKIARKEKNMTQYNHFRGSSRICRQGSCKNSTGGALFCSLDCFEKHKVTEKEREEHWKNNLKVNTDSKYDFEKIKDSSMADIQANQEMGASAFENVLNEVFPGGPKIIGENFKLEKRVCYTDFDFYGPKNLECEAPIRKVTFVYWNQAEKVVRIRFIGNEYSVPEDYIYTKDIRNNHPKREEYQKWKDDLALFEKTYVDKVV